MCFPAVLQGACHLVWPVEFCHQMSPAGTTEDICCISILAVCVCACTRFGTFNKHQCFFFPRYCFCLLISSLLFLASYSFPLLSFWFCHTALLHIYEYFLNKQCRSAFKYQDQCCCCIKENCLAQLPAALCRNSPLGEAERKSAL